MRWPMIVTAAVLTALAGAAAAHHSFTATYFEDRTMEIEGKLLQFMFRNPHSFVHVEAPDENGQLQRWAVEWGGAGQLSGQGVTNQTLRVGDVVIDHRQPRPRSGRSSAAHAVPAPSRRRLRVGQESRRDVQLDRGSVRTLLDSASRCAWSRPAPVPASAQLSLVGEWAGRYHEDQGDRVPGDVQGDFTGVPLNDAARRYAEAFDVTRVAVLEHQCQPYNVAHIYRGPMQFRVLGGQESRDAGDHCVPAVHRHVHAVAHDLDGRPRRIRRRTCRTRTWASRPASGTATSSRSRRRTSRRSSIAAAASRAAT